MRRWVKAATRAAVVIGSLPEVAHRLASKLEYGNPPAGPDTTEALIVLGCPTNPDGSLHPLQRWRVDIAARTMNPRVRVVVFTGTTAKTGISEASAMAAYARSQGIPGSLIVLEEEALTTWQNLEFSAPLVNQHDVLRLVSDPMHAWRARQFLARQNPQLASKLGPAVDYRPLERWRWKLGTMIYELVARYREWRNPRLPARHDASGR
ncbi:YdcF family protein [Tessaracoccus sp. MC1756]|uniref:YdcF family protein n=1 Tax=Tessaracoccus sp. MC1756 TaxID=2760311 RepID=UPI0016012C64|nr:YdcF family protein [Tessaracoccus sp. MC1756]MBB1510754.1 YdcF family protein [Tessaracoccus sp. MC1756]